MEKNKMIEAIIEYKEESQALELIEKTKTICITSQEKYDEAGLLKVSINEEREKKFQLWEDLRRPAYESYQNILKNMKTELEPFDAAIKKIQSMMDEWATERKRKAREEQERLEREAREKAERERERLLDRAAKAEEKGNVGKAEDLMEQAEQVFQEPVFTKYEPPKGARADVVLIITDVKKICEEIGAGRIPTTVVEVKEVKLKRWIMMHDKRCGNVPGVIIRESIKTTVRK